MSGVENEVGKLSLASSAEQSEKEYENYIFKLNSIEKEEVKRLARENNLTMNTVFQGALGILLRSYIGKEDLLFGITISGRPVNLEGVEDIVGLFINTVPLRIRAKSGDRILSYLGELQQATQLINENGYLSLADIQKIPMHQTGRLFDVAFEFSNFLVNEVGNDNVSGNLKVKLLKGIVKAEYPLSVVVLPGEEIEIRLNYQSKYLSKQIIARFEDHFREVLRCMAENPEMVIGNIDILSAFEQRKILTEWNNTKVDYRPARSIQELFEKQVDKTPNAKALACGTISMSYNELNNRANQLAHYLKRYGVGPEVLVGIGMERSQEMIIAILGILKAGGGYVPLDMSYPEERLQYMLEDSKVGILLTQSNVSEKFASYNGKLLEVDRNEELEKEKASNPNNNIATGDNVAYVIYTSGSTGRPKGVVVKQSSVVLSTQARCEYYPNITRFILISSIGFDSSVAGIFSTLLSGGELILVKSKEFDLEELARLIREKQISHMLCTPSVYYALMEHDKKENIISNIQNVIVAGEACSKGLIESHFNAPQNPRLYNEYGPTECTVWSTVHEIRDKDRSENNIGRPISNVRIYILDESLNPVPEGIVGEIYITGVGVSRGYIGRADLTAERFIANPHSNEAMDRLYRTGDLGRYIENGEIEFIGRRDEQIKIRGYRIELGEIEAILSKQSVVSQVAVILKGENEHKKLIAYIVAKEAVKERTSYYTEELRTQLLKAVPEYMIPTFFVFIENLPLTVNGKIDKKALPDIEANYEEGYIAPRNKIEEELCEIWKEVLKLDRIGITDNFFKLVDTHY